MTTETELLVGVDEAGYGPNLGPLVVAAFGIELPPGAPAELLWDRLAPAVSRHPAPDPSAIVIDDSKKVYNSGDGLSALERGALALLRLNAAAGSLREAWRQFSLTPAGDIDELPWHAGYDVLLPAVVGWDESAAAARRLADALERAALRPRFLACQILMPRRFNEAVARLDSKSTALFAWNAELLRRVWDTGHRRIRVKLDKHGGRHFYRELLQDAFTETLVLCARESAASSHYVIESAGRRMDVTFQPKADGRYLPVAAASMVAKYLRELWMRPFNSFWTARVPGLTSTAGYPTDAQRFRRAIEPALRDLNLAPELFWRSR
jgi:ribonuclease HII